MGHMVPERLNGLQRKPLAARLREGESHPKKLGTASDDRDIPLLMERFLALTGLNRDQFADAMGYSDASTVSRWFSGLENPNMKRIWAVRKFRGPFVMAQAEHAHEDVEVRTVVTIRRQA